VYRHIIDQIVNVIVIKIIAVCEKRCVILRYTASQIKEFITATPLLTTESTLFNFQVLFLLLTTLTTVDRVSRLFDQLTESRMRARTHRFFRSHPTSARLVE